MKPVFVVRPIRLSSLCRRAGISVNFLAPTGRSFLCEQRLHRCCRAFLRGLQFFFRPDAWGTAESLTTGFGCHRLHSESRPGRAWKVIASTDRPLSHYGSRQTLCDGGWIQNSAGENSTDKMEHKIIAMERAAAGPMVPGRPLWISGKQSR
jgi:hypothetical protein